MKPSERIKQILGKETYNDKEVGQVLEAIIVVLDEEYENNNPANYGAVSKVK